MKVILELDDWQLRMGYVRSTIVDEKGQRPGLITINELAELVGKVFRWDIAHREVRLLTRFHEMPYIAFGQNGSKWVAVKEIPPADYFLVSVAGQAYKVGLPRLVARVGNESSPFLFWTDEGELTLKSKLYPLIIGNIRSDGWVCLGSTGLKCKTPEDIDEFIRKAVEAPSTGTYVPAKDLDKFYRVLQNKWARGIGRKNAITLEKLLKQAV